MNDLSSKMKIHNVLVRSSTYKLLAKSFLYPTQEIYDFVCSQLYQDSLSDLLLLPNLTPEVGKNILAFREMVANRQRRKSREELESEYNRLFAHLGSAKCPPYETEYGYDNVFQKTQAMADIAGFYSAYGLEPADKNTERVDFVSTELEFMSYLALKEVYAHECSESEHVEICVDTQRKFLRDHLGHWITIFAKILSNSTGNEFYLQLGKITEEFLEVEARLLGVELDKVEAPNKFTEGLPTPFGCEACVLKASDVTAGERSNSASPS